MQCKCVFCSVWASMRVDEPHTGQHTVAKWEYFLSTHTHLYNSTTMLLRRAISCSGWQTFLSAENNSIDLLFNTELEQYWMILSDCKAKLARLKHIKGEY